MCDKRVGEGVKRQEKGVCVKRGESVYVCKECVMCVCVRDLPVGWSLCVLCGLPMRLQSLGLCGCRIHLA